MDTKQLFDEEVAKCRDESMTVQERRCAYAYFLRGWHLKRAEVSQARSEGRESGLREAAGIASAKYPKECGTVFYSNAAENIEAAILAAITSPPNIGEGERCEWVYREDQGGRWESVCGRGCLLHPVKDLQFACCPTCGKPIRVKE